MNPALEKLVKRLQEIAAHNEDEFSYRINIEPFRGGFQYEFVCEETADSHTFVSNIGGTIDEACRKIFESGSLESACKEWGYELP